MTLTFDLLTSNEIDDQKLLCTVHICPHAKFSSTTSALVNTHNIRLKRRDMEHKEHSDDALKHHSNKPVGYHKSSKPLDEVDTSLMNVDKY